jgi:hypothetical protein
MDMMAGGALMLLVIMTAGAIFAFVTGYPGKADKD